MKVTIASLVRAFVDIAETLPAEELPALADAAAAFLVSHGLGKQAHAFPRAVEREWLRREGAISAKLTTVSGHALSLARDLGVIIQKALDRPCHIAEQADPLILGGVLLTVGDERYDCTLRGALQDLSVRISQPVPLS